MPQEFIDEIAKLFPKTGDLVIDSSVVYVFLLIFLLVLIKGGFKAFK